MTTEDLENVVIIGGGIQGVSVAANLAKKGLKRVWLIEMLPSFGLGTTQRAAGMFSNTMMDEEPMVRLNIQAMKKMLDLEREFGFSPQFTKIGNLVLAVTPKTEDRCKKQVDLQMRYGIDTRILTPDECKAIAPYLNTKDVKVGMYCPNDGYVNIASIVEGYQRYAQKLGVNFLSNTRAIGIEKEGNKIVGVRIRERNGEEVGIPTKLVVNAAGALADEVTSWAGIKEVPFEREGRTLWSVKLQGDDISNMPLIAIEGGPHNWSYVRPDFQNGKGRCVVGIGQTVKFEEELHDLSQAIAPMFRD